MEQIKLLALKAPIATKVICFSRLLKCLRSLNDKQFGPRSGSTMFASILKFVRNVRQLFAADDLSRRHFSDAFFLGALRVRIFHMGLDTRKPVFGVCKQQRCIPACASAHLLFFFLKVYLNLLQAKFQFYS